MKNTRIFLMIAMLALVLTFVSCKGDDPELSDLTAETEKSAVLAQALGLLEQADLLSNEYESFVQTTETTSSYDGNVISSLRTVMKKSGNSSVFAGTGIEVMKAPYLGAHGHIAIRTNYIERAKYHMELQGFAFDEATAKKDAKGNLVAVYLKGELGGFAVHLVQK